MSLLKFLLKSKKEMAKPNTFPIKVGKYYITSHAQNRIVDKTRSLKRIYLVDNLYLKPLGETKVIYKSGEPSYNRVGRYCTASINPLTNNVCTVRRISNKEILDFKLRKKKGSRKYVKKS